MAKKKTTLKSAKKKVGRPAKKNAARKVAKKTRPASTIDESFESLLVWVNLNVGEPGLVRILRSEIDLSKFYQFLDVLTFGSGANAMRLIGLCTNESTEEWNEEEDGTRYVWISGPIGVPSSIECGKNEPGAIEHDASFPADRGASPYWTRTWTKAERQRLLDAVGSQVQATIRFRATGDSPALEEGKDIEWLKPCLLNIEAAELGGADHD